MPVEKMKYGLVEFEGVESDYLSTPTDKTSPTCKEDNSFKTPL